MDTNLDAYLHRALIRHGELKVLAGKFLRLAGSRNVDVASKYNSSI